MRDIPIDQVMTPDPATISPQSSAAEARRLLDSNVINHLPVVEDGRLVGILSSSDFLKLHLLDGKLQIVADATVSQIMETKVVVLNKNSTLVDAAEKLSVGGFHALPVVDRKRRLLGIVTSSDLIGELVRRLNL
ncbi:MAG: CBS domain-containing protein [Gammaproteobacteria bacterium]|nr:CBS domain-containing protein [Gammaproteobacteria bacterium]MDH5617963.1 CBS domain-containing protein [Gammaproteobacteria bacterium]